MMDAALEVAAANLSPRWLSFMGVLDRWKRRPSVWRWRPPACNGNRSMRKCCSRPPSAACPNQHTIDVECDGGSGSRSCQQVPASIEYITG